MSNVNVLVFVGVCIVISIIVACVSGLGFPAALATTLVFGGGYALGRLLTVIEYKQQYNDTLKSMNEDK